MLVKKQPQKNVTGLPGTTVANLSLRHQLTS